MARPVDGHCPRPALRSVQARASSTSEGNARSVPRGNVRCPLCRSSSRGKRLCPGFFVRPPDQPPTDLRRLITTVIASTVGTTIEWYDFFLYGTAAALVFPATFFPDQSPFVGQIYSFGTFSVGFLSRPLGGAIFGRIGDQHGRKAALVATLLLMGISTLLIGLLPTYRQIGIAAPLLLVSLRFLQGIGVGGEWGGAVLLALESGHRGRRGLLASFPQAGVPIGLL